jgi:hypothetical protein
MTKVPLLHPGETMTAALHRLRLAIVREAIERHGSKSAAARALGMTREGVYKLLHREPRLLLVERDGGDAREVLGDA